MKILKLPAIFQAPGFFSECPNVWAKVKIFLQFFRCPNFSGRLNAHNFGASGFFPSAQNFWAEMKISNLYNLCRQPKIFKTAQIFSSIWKKNLLNIFEHQNFPSYQNF
jgi:hypothetical protein